MAKVEFDREIVNPIVLVEQASREKLPPGPAPDFWVQTEIDLFRWNKLYPYQLMIVKSTDRGFEPLGPDWTFTLPIPPQNVSKDMLPTFTSMATEGGIHENRSAPKFKMITMSGTLGVLPSRGGGPQQTTAGISSLFGVFGGTIQAANNVVGAVESLKSAATNSPINNPNVHQDEEFSSNGIPLVAKGTGYYQFRRLERFYEKALNLLSKKEGRNLRFALCMWKDQSVYLVTPATFTITKAANSPLEHLYNLSFKAYRRITLQMGDFSTVLPKPLRRDPSKMAQLLNTLTAARVVVQSASKVATALVGDIDRAMLEPMREASLLLRDATGAAKTLGDLPKTIKAHIGKNWETIKTFPQSERDSASTKNRSIFDNLKALEKSFSETRDLVTTRSAADLKSAKGTAPGFQVFNPDRSDFSTEESIGLATLKLPPAIQAQIDAETERVNNITQSEFIAKRDSIRKTADLLAISLGAGNATYEATYSAVAPTLKATPSDSDWEALFALNSVVEVFDALSSSGTDEKEDSFDAMAGLVRKTGTAFIKPLSKFAVPFPYRGTLEQLAQQYLGNIDRWHEIAVLNGLQAPYVDEEGFDCFLLANGIGDTLTIPYTPNLYIGQSVYISSTGASRTRRRITDLTRVDTQLIVRVDGTANMQQFRTNDSAYLTAFLPDTVNSQSLIYIPSSEEPAEDDFITRDIPGVDEFDPMIAIGGVDLLLDSTNDLVFTEDGDCRYAWGMTNLIQIIRVALSINRGTLMRHPNFGFADTVGQSVANLNATAAVDRLRHLLGNDFPDVSIGSVKFQRIGGTSKINMTITPIGTKKPIPLTYTVDPGYQKTVD